MAERLAILGGEPVRAKPFPQWPQIEPSDERALLSVLLSGNWSHHRGTVWLNLNRHLPITKVLAMERDNERVGSIAHSFADNRCGHR